MKHATEAGKLRVVSVSIDPPPVAAAFRAGVGARWTFLCDPDRVWQEKLELREVTDTVYRPYLPTVFSLFPDLSVHRRYDGYWYLGRATMAELKRDLREISAAVRPDWSAPS